MFRRKSDHYEYKFFAARDRLSDNEGALMNLGSQGWKFVEHLYRHKQPGTNGAYNSSILMERKTRW